MANLPIRRDRRDVLPARWDPVRELEELRERLDLDHRAARPKHSFEGPNGP